jgi:dihydrofolate reductase
MRKLIVSMNCTLDGYLSGQQCEMDWHFKHWTADMGDALCKHLSNADTVLMGRVTYQVFSRFADPRLQMNSGYDNFPFFDMMNRYKKIVFSKTLHTVHWQHTVICKTSLKQKVLHLKKQAGKNVMLYGSSKLLYNLQQLDIIDGYHLYIHPVLLGKGKRLFADELTEREFHTRLVERFSGGVVLIELSRI